MPIAFNEAGIAEVNIGGHCDIVRTGEFFQRTFEYVDGNDQPRDFTDAEVDSAIVFDPFTLETLATLTVEYSGDKTLGVLIFQIEDADMPAAGEWSYRARFTNGSAPKRSVQEGRFTVGVSA